MPRMIDADKVIKRLEKILSDRKDDDWDFLAGINLALKIVNDTPAESGDGLVHCADCEYWGNSVWKKDTFCPMVEDYTAPNAYCFMGVRRNAKAD